MSGDHSSTRVVLAKADGWTELDWYEDSAGPAILTGKAPHDYPPRLGRSDTSVPSYECSLEQVRRLEFKLVPDDAYAAYLHLLENVCAAPDNCGMSGLVAPVARVNRYACASAAQRCKALVSFLRMTNSVKEESQNGQV